MATFFIDKLVNSESQERDYNLIRIRVVNSKIAFQTLKIASE